MGTAPAQRLQSLDLFRGATIASMILVNNAGGEPVYAQLEHASWHGWTFTDTVFPFFLWIVGLAMTLSTAKRVERGENKRALLVHLVRRFIIIFAIGMLAGPFPKYDWATIRIPGVLQRIALCYLIAGVIFLYTRVRGQIIALLSVNILYIGLMFFYPTPGCGAGSLTVDCNFARYFDGLLLSGHMWRATKVWDPEGLVSTLPAIGTVLFGILAGHLLRQFTGHAERLKWFFGGGAALVAAAYVGNLWLPFNKALWTTSYALLMAGLAMVLFGAWYWISDMRGWGGRFKFFEIFGTNAILMFVLSGQLGKYAGKTGLHKWFYENVCLAIAAPINASVIYALSNVLVLWIVAWALWRRRWFVKF
jgi:predicted acyltransferase